MRLSNLALAIGAALIGLVLGGLIGAATAGIVVLLSGVGLDISFRLIPSKEMAVCPPKPDSP